MAGTGASLSEVSPVAQIIAKKKKSGRRALIFATPPKRGRVTVWTEGPGPLGKARHYSANYTIKTCIHQVQARMIKIFSEFPRSQNNVRRLQAPVAGRQLVALWDHTSSGPPNAVGKARRAASTSRTSTAL